MAKRKMRNVFIMGIFRSGTSLLSTCLNAHENVRIAWQPYWLFFKASRNKFFSEVIRKPLDVNYPMGVLQFTSEKERRLFCDIFRLVKFDGAELSSLISQIGDYLGYEEEKVNRDMKPTSLLSYLHGLESGTAGHILSQLMKRLYLSESNTYCANKENIDIVGIKEVFCEEYIEPILNYQGLDSVVLHIIRDPRAVVASRNYGKYMEATGSRYPIFFIIRSWRRTVANYLSNKDKENYLMIRYEDLVSQPGEIMNQICRALELPFSEDVLNFSMFRNSSGGQWEPNTSFEGTKSINTLSVERWKSVLQPDEIEVIEFFCQSELEYLGYEITTGRFDVEKISNFKEDVSYINDWLRKYNFNYSITEDRLNLFSTW